MESSSKKSQSGSTAAWIIGGLALIYFGCPPLLIYPFTLVWGKSTSAFPSHVMGPLTVALTPVFFLSDRIPAYDNFLNWESKIIGID